ncbi:hypothetical protein ACEPAF_1801 [Sanghuangporus sanghuang]
MTLPQFIDPDDLPFAGPSPTISGFTMPLPGDKSIPKIDVSGSPTSIPRFFDTVYLLGRTASLSDCHIIAWARFYAPAKEQPLWRHCAEVAGNNYSAFRDAALKMYPHSQPVYTLQDLRRLILSTQALPSFTLESYGGFLQDFHRVSGYLLQNGEISTFEEQRMFMEGIPAAYHRELNFSLRLTDPEHAAGIPWPVEAVTDEIQRIVKVQQVLAYTESPAPLVEAYYASTSPPAISHIQNTLGVDAHAKNKPPMPAAPAANGLYASPANVWPPQPKLSPSLMPTNALITSPAPWHVQRPTLALPLTFSPVAHQAQPTHFLDMQKCSSAPNAFAADFPAPPPPPPAKCKASADDSSLQNITTIPLAYPQALAASCNVLDQWPIPGVSLIPATHERFYRRLVPGAPAPHLASANLRQPSKHPPKGSQAPPAAQACSICGFTMHRTAKCPTRSFLLNSGITVADMRGRLMQPDGRPFTGNHSGGRILDQLNRYFTRNVNMIPLRLQIPILPLPDDLGLASAPQELPPNRRRKPPRQWGVPQDTPGAGHTPQAKLQGQTPPNDTCGASMVLEQLPDMPPSLATAPQVRKVPSPFGTILPKPTAAIPDDPDEPINPLIQHSKAYMKAYSRQASLTNAADTPPPWKPPAGFPKVLDKPLAPAVVPLHEINVRLNDTLQVNGVLDSGSSFIGIPRRIWRQIKSPACISNPTHIQTASPNPSQSSHIIPCVKISLPGFSMHAPVYILKNAPFDLLLGRPFFAHTHAVTADLDEHFQTLYITDPVTGEVFCLPTSPRTPLPVP